MIPATLIGLSLGLYNLYWVRFGVLGGVIGFYCFFTSTVSYVVFKTRSKDDDAGMSLENEYKFGCCSSDNFRFFLRTATNPLKILY